MRQRIPMTIMAMMLPLFHLSPDEEARLNGRRKSEKPAVTRRMPNAVVF
jgi:hypothetical protein